MDAYSRTFLKDPDLATHAVDKIAAALSTTIPRSLNTIAEQVSLPQPTVKYLLQLGDDWGYVVTTQKSRHTPLAYKAAYKADTEWPQTFREELAASGIKKLLPYRNGVL